MFAEVEGTVSDTFGLAPSLEVLLGSCIARCVDLGGFLNVSYLRWVEVVGLPTGVEGGGVSAIGDILRNPFWSSKGIGFFCEEEDPRRYSLLSASGSIHGV